LTLDFISLYIIFAFSNLSWPDVSLIYSGAQKVSPGKSGPYKSFGSRM